MSYIQIYITLKNTQETAIETAILLLRHISKSKQVKILVHSGRLPALGIVVFIHERLPHRVLLPHPLSNGIDRHAFGLGQKEHHEYSHSQDPSREEEEDERAHVAEHREERLGDDESHEHV